jgi:putative acetyltransferase
VAVRTDKQRQGVGQALLRHGLTEMAKSGAAVAITYGDPAYYRMVGFAPVSKAEVAAPYPPQFPEGWQAQNLTGALPGR